MKNKKQEKDTQKTCGCSDECTCGCNEGKPCTCEDKNCTCGCHEDGCNCECDCGCKHGEECTCECECENEDCGCNCGCEQVDSKQDNHKNAKSNNNHQCGCGQDQQKNLAEEYLNLLRVVQADFDNYRKRSLSQIEKAKIDGIASTVEVLLPSLDAFSKVKKGIKDKTILEGIVMLEKQIEKSLEKLGVEKIESIGKLLDPNLHNAVAVASKNGAKDGEIIEEFQAGYKMGDKIIRYSQVLVNKIN